MNKFANWLSKVFSESISKIVIGYLAGSATIILGIISINEILDLLSSRISVPVVLLLIVSLFALVGIISACLPLWNLISIHRKKDTTQKAVDEDLERTSAALLKKLNTVEVGIEIFVASKIQKFRSEFLGLFDAWETAIVQYCDSSTLEQLQEFRERIRNLSPHTSQQKASCLVKDIKRVTNEARKQVC